MARESFVVDPARSRIGFQVRHLLFARVHGTFRRWSCRFELDEENPSASSVEVRIDAASIETHEEARDAELRSPGFLDVARYPEIVFRSTSVAAWGKRYRIAGDLTIRGVTRPVTVEAERRGRAPDPTGAERIGFAARAASDRKDFGLTWSQVVEVGGLAVGDRVEMVIEIEAVKAA